MFNENTSSNTIEKFNTAEGICHIFGCVTKSLAGLLCGLFLSYGTPTSCLFATRIGQRGRVGHENQHAKYKYYMYLLERRGSVMVIARPLSMPLVAGSTPGPGTWHVITCKNLALYIRDCVSLCLSDETLNPIGPFYLGYMPGEVKYPTQAVNV